MYKRSESSGATGSLVYSEEHVCDGVRCVERRAKTCYYCVPITTRWERSGDGYQAKWRTQIEYITSNEVRGHLLRKLVK